MSDDLSRGDVALAAALYAKAMAPWAWQAGLRRKLAAAYTHGVTDALAVHQQRLAVAGAGAPMANPVRRPFQPGDPI